MKIVDRCLLRNGSSRVTRFLRPVIAGVSVAVPLALAGSGVAAPSAARYTITDLTASRGSYSAAHGINSAGDVAGDEDGRAVVWTAGKKRELGLLPESSQASASAINDRGDVAGTCERGSLRRLGEADRAFLYRAGKLQALGTLGGTNSKAFALNNRGEVVGQADTADNGFHAVRWKDGRAVELVASSDSSARAINDAGQIVGVSPFITTQGQSGVDFVLLRDTAHPVVLPLETRWFAYGLSAKGVVVGQAQNGGPGTPGRAFLWKEGKSLDLGTLGGADSVALAVNYAEQVVGHSELEPAPAPGSGTPWHAFLYEGSRMRDLNDLIPAGTGWVLQSAEGINQAGQIAGWGSKNGGRQHAFLLTPKASR